MDRAKSQIEKLEKEIFEKKKMISEILQTLPPIKIKNYELKQLDGTHTDLKHLFKDKTEMIIIHNMGKEFSYCTLWADGLRGLTHYINDRCAFILEMDKDIKEIAEFKEKRGWNFNVVSSQGSTLKKDLGFEYENNGKVDYLPGFSTLFLDGDVIFCHTSSFFGPMDEYCSVWPLFDRLKKGINDWSPSFQD